MVDNSNWQFIRQNYHNTRAQNSVGIYAKFGKEIKRQNDNG